jgi:hypothetical protein
MPQPDREDPGLAEKTLPPLVSLEDGVTIVDGREFGLEQTLVDFSVAAYWRDERRDELLVPGDRARGPGRRG